MIPGAEPDWQGCGGLHTPGQHLRRERRSSLCPPPCAHHQAIALQMALTRHQTPSPVPHDAGSGVQASGGSTHLGAGGQPGRPRRCPREFNLQAASFAHCPCHGPSLEQLLAPALFQNRCCPASWGLWRELRCADLRAPEIRTGRWGREGPRQASPSPSRAPWRIIDLERRGRGLARRRETRRRVCDGSSAALRRLTLQNLLFFFTTELPPVPPCRGGQGT